MPKETKDKDLNKMIKKVPGRVTVLKVMPYKGATVYIRRIDIEMFEYLLIFDNQLYSDYVLFIPEDGKKDLTDAQVRGAAGITFIAATTTVDELIKMRESNLLSNSLPNEKLNKRKNLSNLN